MGFLVSPGVDVNEIDLTNVIPAVSTSIGGYAGPFRWGPVDQIVTVSSEKDLVSVYGKPDAAFAESFFTAASFLKYGNTLKVSRAFTLTGSVIAVGTPVVTTLASTAANPIIAAANTALNTTNNATRTVSSVMTATSITITDSITVGSVKTVRELTRTYTGVSSDITVPTTLVITTIAIADATTTNKTVYSAFGALSESGSVITTATGCTQTATQTITSSGATSTIFNSLSGGEGAPAPTTASAIFIKASDNFNEISYTPAPIFAARHAGILGDSLKVVIVNASTSTTNNFAMMFDYKPEGDEFHMQIIDTLGNFSGTANSILESYVGLSTSITSKRVDGTSNYYKTVLNSNSSYVYASASLILSTSDTAKIFLFGGGAESTPSDLSTSAVQVALDLFSDAETVDVNLIFAYGTSAGTIASAGETKLQLLASKRKDCVAFISAPITISSSTSESAKLGLITSKFSASGITRDSYSVFDSSPLYVYNKYLDNYLWIPACGHMAGLCANTDDVAEPWFSPAGYTRGQLFGVTKLGFNPNQSSRDTMYKLGVNPICAFPGQGTILFGDKTAQAKPSAFDRINVRRLFIVLEKAIATASKYQLFELNDEFTRAMFRNMVEPFLRDVKGRRGITDFLVVCDETNNTGEVIDTNRFVADIYIKPARSINFITLNFIATRTGVEFSEIVGK